MDCFLSKKILEMIFFYDDFFLEKKNVVAVGLGSKIIKNMDTKEPCLKVFVEKKVPINKLLKNELLPKEIFGMKIDVIEVGKTPSFLTYPSDKVSSDNKFQTSNRFQTRLRPIEPACSISQYKNMSAGTLGAIVFDNETNEPYILSNNHVLVNQDEPKKQMAILQPGHKYGGSSNLNIIAMGTRYIPIKTTDYNLVDCAVTKILPHVNYLKRIFIIGEISGIADAKENEEVVKVGATSQYTEGKVIATNVSLSVLSSHKVKLSYKNQIAVSRMSEDGDSGSIYLNYKTKAIGLGFCATDTTTFLNPIFSVLASLNVHF
ncbi:hypothetical protein [Clostridium tarantellae]|uniref:Serine protease n=1 Tax=Clostridium tarantellae TaxID=39493 RepID=A0A6I1MP60_9CLOT|nr:hypothetical protein [Clostridium tarantellae]MPQ44720.1 hypothetical protein [Clostridium tarantellae]